MSKNDSQSRATTKAWCVRIHAGQQPTTQYRLVRQSLVTVPRRPGDQGGLQQEITPCALSSSRSSYWCRSDHLLCRLKIKRRPPGRSQHRRRIDKRDLSTRRQRKKTPSNE